MTESRLYQYPENVAQDSYIVNTSPSSNFSNNLLLRAGVDNTGSIARMIFKVSFGDINQNVTLEKAELRLYCHIGATGTYDFHMFTGGFSEIMTWSGQSSFDSTPFLSLENFTFESGKWYTINLLEPCKKWLTGTNNGFIMKSRSSTALGSQVVFFSSSYSENWLRPSLYYEFRSGRRNKKTLLNNNSIGGVISC